MSKFDAEHPWVDASLHGSPSPVPTNVKLENVELTGEGEKPVPAAMATFVTPLGVFNFFLPPAALASLFSQSHAILSEWRQEENNGLVVANKSDMREAVSMQEALDRMNRKNGS